MRPILNHLQARHSEETLILHEALRSRQFLLTIINSLPHILRQAIIMTPQTIRAASRA